MPECDYCERSFDSESAYLDHLAESHEDELGRIDRRRVDAHTSSSGVDIPPMAIYGVAGLAILAVAAAGIYYVVGVFSAGTPVHEHGSLDVTVDGESIDFYQHEEYVRPDGDPEPDFHVHSDTPGIWHMHPEEPGRLTISEAFAEIGVELTDSRLSIGGDTYDASEDGVELFVTVDGEQVDPESHELEEGDSLRVVVQTGSAS